MFKNHCDSLTEGAPDMLAEDVLYEISGFDPSKFPAFKKLKVSEMGKMLVSREKKIFVEWLVNENIKDKTK